MTNFKETNRGVIVPLANDMQLCKLGEGVWMGGGAEN
jgi:hypothetical protein